MTQTGTKILEKKFQAEVIKYLQAQGAYVLKTHVSSFQKQGEPDLTVCFRGVYIAFELKKDSQSETTKLQDYKLNAIRRAGGYALRVDNLNQVKEVLYEISRVRQGGKPTK